MFQEFKQFTPRILSFSALSCRQSTELINIRRSQCLSIMHIYIYILVMKPVCAHVKPNVFINEYKKILETEKQRLEKLKKKLDNP